MQILKYQPRGENQYGQAYKPRWRKSLLAVFLCFLVSVSMFAWWWLHDGESLVLDWVRQLLWNLYVLMMLDTLLFVVISAIWQASGEQETTNKLVQYTYVAMASIAMAWLILTCTIGIIYTAF